MPCVMYFSPPANPPIWIGLIAFAPSGKYLSKIIICWRGCEWIIKQGIKKKKTKKNILFHMSLQQIYRIQYKYGKNNREM
jgi:hypothetical protein